MVHKYCSFQRFQTTAKQLISNFPIGAELLFCLAYGFPFDHLAHPCLYVLSHQTSCVRRETRFESGLMSQQVQSVQLVSLYRRQTFKIDPDFQILNQRLPNHALHKFEGKYTGSDLCYCCSPDGRYITKNVT